MKSTVSIYFEELYDKESEEIYNSLSEEDRQKFFANWKEEVENVVRNEFGRNIENLSIEFGVVK